MFNIYTVFPIDGTFIDTIRIVMGICTGVFMIVIAAKGRLFTKMNTAIRFFFALGGMCLVANMLLAYVIGIVIFLQVIMYQDFLAKREEASRLLAKR